jgi:hypothetical protein
MIAFFLTMPISRMMPMMPMTSRSSPADQQREQRADAGRRQRREDRDRMDEALVEHAEHDVHRDDRREHQQQLVAQRRLERRRRALERGDEARRQADVLLGLLGSRRPPRRASARRGVERDRGRRKLAQMLICSGPARCSTCTIADSGTWPLVVDDDDGR